MYMRLVGIVEAALRWIPYFLGGSGFLRNDDVTVSEEWSSGGNAYPRN